jgi:predicted lipid-binding transport protein (Tim44 family)
MGGLMGGIGGLLLGGLIGSMLFGGTGGGLGGFGLMEMIILGVLGYLAFSFFRRRSQQQPQPAMAGAPGYAGSGYAPARIEPAPIEARATAVEPLAGPSDLDRGMGHIRQTDLAFDPARLAQDASQSFFRIQSAWSARDLTPVRDLLTPEMADSLQADLERLRAQGQTNRIENMLMQGAEVTEAWQESGQDFVTVRLAATLLDYTVEDASGRVVEGSRTAPVSFQEFWTFVRPVGPNPWRLTAIQQGG